VVNGKEVERASSKERANGREEQERPEDEERRRIDEQHCEQSHHHLILRHRFLLLFRKPGAEARHHVHGRVHAQGEEEEGQAEDARERVAEEEGECPEAERERRVLRWVEG
jgi:hypothetical protein